MWSKWIPLTRLSDLDFTNWYNIYMNCTNVTLAEWAAPEVPSTEHCIQYICRGDTLITDDSRTSSRQMTPERLFWNFGYSYASTHWICLHNWKWQDNAIQNCIRLIHHTDSFNLSSLSLYLSGCWLDLQINVYSKRSVLMVEMAAGSFSAAKLHNRFYACPLLFKLFLHTKLVLFWNSTMLVLKEHNYQLTAAMQSTCTKYKHVLQWLQWWVLFNF